MRQPVETRIFVFMGLVASGKSTLAMAWAEKYGMEYFNSDVVRKELAGVESGVDSRKGLGTGIYTEELTAKTYAALLERAGAALGRGRAAVLDASYVKSRERGRVREFARIHGVPVCFIHCFCSDEITGRRLDERARDPLAVSDGNREVYQHQLRVFEAPDELSGNELLELDTDRRVSDLVAIVEGWLKKGSAG